jgi:dolichyl-phosphate-mannose-protein mannosyltransferase
MWLKLVGAVALAAGALRFVALDVSPPGFYIDEAAIAAQVICVRQSGKDIFGTPWPLFSPVLGGGYVTPPYLYSGIAWTAVFGDSIVAFRSIAALFGALTVVGVFCLAQALWRRRPVSGLAALCASLSPWGFLFSRIAWDPPLAPCLFVWGLFLLLQDSRWPRLSAGLGGISVALACYSYPPMRVQAALTIPVCLLLAYRRGRRWAVIAPFAITLSVALIPLARMMMSSQFQGRSSYLSIFNEHYLSQFGGFSVPLVLRLFFGNLATHLSPGYLFWSGDRNLRHSTQASGEWGALEILGLATALGLLLARRSIWRDRGEALSLGLTVIAYVFALVPAALTWEANPHALRSIGGYPFVALLAGFALARGIEVWPRLPAVILIVALVCGGWYFWDFFTRYPGRAAAWFNAPVAERALAIPKTGRVADYDLLHSIEGGYPDLAIFYFKLSSGSVMCRPRTESLRSSAAPSSSSAKAGLGGHGRE